MCVLSSKPVGMAFSPIHPIILIATTDGHINFIYVRPYDGRNKYKCFARVKVCEKENIITSFSFELIINSYLSKDNLLIQNVPGNHHMMIAVGLSSG